MAMETWAIDNDTRGWIMCIVSGIACVVGASIICVDVIVQLIPGQRNFRIQDSKTFLASSLSLSFGVMLFSALYSMLPESRDYLKKTDWSHQFAGLVQMSCFIGGFIGIQIVSRFLHQFMPTHVVDCDHSHKESTATEGNHPQNGRRQSRVSRTRRRESTRRSSIPPIAKSVTIADGHDHDHAIVTESTPLLDSERNGRTKLPKRHASARGDEMVQRSISPSVVNRARAATGNPDIRERRGSIVLMQKRVLSFVKDTKCNCDESGSCYGFTDPCGQECFKHINKSGPNSSRTVLRTTTGPFYPHSGSVFHGGIDRPDRDEEHVEPISPRFRTSRATSREPTNLTLDDEEEPDTSGSSVGEDVDVEAQHHHHVPTNAFLSIGLQTSIAIALHKFPEGFITYATNHANPSLGFNVFMALFVHNISEGFAMALPLYMAIGSRWRAMAWSALLGGLSQPLGAGVAALWFKVADRTHMTPNVVAYACLFAMTAGIMVSVALQLFVESLSLNHNRTLCMSFAFLGMAILGLSNALVSEH
ncbi:Fc.00g109310.m01.CDS01 [Cosmosporella sp. VM-42]